MSSSIFFPIGALPFSLVIIILFFGKKSISSKETWIYKTLIVSNFFGLIVEILCTFASMIYDTYHLLSVFILKLYLLYLIFWISTIGYYVFSTVRNENNIRRNRIGVFLIYYFVISLILALLPVNLVLSEDFNVRYTTGPSVLFTYFLSFVAILVMVLLIIKNIDKIKQKRFFPIILFLIFGGLAAVVQIFNPALLLMTYVETLIGLIMYFTIENPDMKMLEVYEENRELTERSIEEKSNLLFKISEDVREPISNIEKISTRIIKSNELEEINIDAREINKISKDISDNINNVLDITTMDKQNIKLIDSKYNFYNIVNQIIIQAKEKTNEKGLEFKYNISSTIPLSLYGDSVKIKQIIYSVLLNAINNTKKGTIDLDISSLNRNDITRLIITIRDTGKTMALNKINEILASSEELNDKELSKINDLDIDLKVTKKIIDILGGTLIIKSEKKIGSTFTIILNQLNEIANDKLTISLSNKDKVIVVNDDYYELNNISEEIRKYNFNVKSIIYGPDLIDKLNSGEKYKYIFIDDEMKPKNAIEIIKEIDYKKYNIVVMLNKEKEFLKDKYLEDKIYNNYIIKDNYKEDIRKIIGNND